MDRDATRRRLGLLSDVRGRNAHTSVGARAPRHARARFSGGIAMKRVSLTNISPQQYLEWSRRVVVLDVSTPLSDVRAIIAAGGYDFAVLVRETVGADPLFYAIHHGEMTG